MHLPPLRFLCYLLWKVQIPIVPAPLPLGDLRDLAFQTSSTRAAIRRECGSGEATGPYLFSTHRPGFAPLGLHRHSTTVA
jgi:hypothetical protein